MPRIPLAPQVASRPAGTPYQRADANTGAEAIGKGLQQFGAGLSQATDTYRKAKEDADNFRVDQADLEFSKAITETLYNKQDGFMLQRGEKAMDSAPVYEKLERAKEKIAEGLSDDQRKIFARRSTARGLQVKDDVERHSGREQQAYYEKLTDGQVANALTSIAQNHASASHVETQVQLAEESLRRYLSRNGLPAEQVEATVKKFHSQAYGTALDGYIGAGDAAGAKAYFEAVKGNLGTSVDKYGKAVRELENTAAVEGKAREILHGSRMEGYPWIDTDKALAETDKLPDGDPNKAKIRALVEHQAQKAKQVRDEAGKQKFREALSMYHQGVPLNGTKMAAVKAYLLDPNNGATEYWDKLIAEDEHRRNERLRTDAEARRQQQEADALALEEFRNRQLRDQVGADVDAEFTGRASPLARERMRGIQKKAKETLDKGQESDESAFRRSMLGQLDQAGFKKNTPRRRNTEAKLWDWYEEYRTTHDGRFPTQKEVKERIGEELLYGETEGVLYNPNKFKGEAKEGEKFKPFPPEQQKSDYARERVGQPAAAPPPPQAKPVTSVAEIPRAERDQIVEALKAAKKPVTTDEMWKLYQKRHGVK